MNMAQTLAKSDSEHQSWLPLLESAAQEVFELMLNCQLTKTQDWVDEPMDTISMVGLAGKLCGLMTIRCSGNSARLMASKMLGIDANEIGLELCDAFGEVCNMVAGNFKNKIPGFDYGCMLSVPTVISGRDYQVQTLKNSEALDLRMLFENLPLAITLQIKG